MVRREQRTDNRVPSYFLVKLRKGDRLHYIFAEMVASFNYPAGGRDEDDDEEGCGDNQTPLIPRKALEKMLRTHDKTAVEVGVEVKNVVTLPEPGDAQASWTYYSVSNQAGDDEPDVGDD